MNTIESGSLWKIQTPMKCRETKIGIDPSNQETIILPVGEIIEFRYHYGVHFRTITNEYYYVDEYTLLKHCERYGEINNDVAWENKLNLDDILKLKLYTLK